MFQPSLFRFPVPWLLTAGTSIILLFLACTSEPKTFDDPQGDFSLTYPSDWDNTTKENAAEFAKRSDVYHIAFGATRFLADDREKIVTSVFPVAWFQVKRGPNLPKYWTVIPSDREFLVEYVYLIDQDSEPTAEKFSSPIQINQGGLVGLEMETTYSQTITLRRFFRLHGDTVIEVICGSRKGRWGSEEKGCREMLEAFVIHP